MTTRPSATVVIEGLLDQLTLEEQVALMAGADFWQTVPVPRLGIPQVKVSDGPNGARGAGGLNAGTPASAFPCGVCLGAGWNTGGAHAMGEALAAEARSKGARVLLAPTVNIHRSGLNGRNFECYSEDPHLTSALAVAYIRGLQENGVGATIKHFVANDSEVERQTMSSDVDERTLREIYLPPFEAAVRKAGVWAVMTGYNRLNGVHMDAQSWAMTDAMRGDYGYDGIFMSDWFGTNSTAESVNAGHDLEMPGPARFRGAKLLEAVRNGEVEEKTIRASCRRLLRLFERVGAFASEGPEPETTREDPETRSLIRRLGADGAVLMKNDKILPLDEGCGVAVIGPNAAVPRMMGGGSAQINAPHRVSPLDGLVEALGADRVSYATGCSNNRLMELVSTDLEVEFFKGRAFEGAPIHRETEHESNFFWFDVPVEDFDPDDFSARVEGRFTVEETGTYRAGLTNAGFARAYLDGELIVDGETDWQKGMNFFGLGNDERRADLELEAGRTYDLRIDYVSPDQPDEGITVRALRFGIERVLGQAEIDEAAAAAAKQDVAILCVGRTAEWDSEGHDLPHMELPGDQVSLIEAVAKANPNTIVALQTGGPVEMGWADKVRAVVQFWYPGQEVGHTMADVLMGKAAPGGRLPQSFPAAMNDSSVWTEDARSYPGIDGHVSYEEGVFVGYRHFDRETSPDAAYPFGFGLGYTEFDWGAPEVSSQIMGDAGVDVAVEIRDVGHRPGTEVVQLYVRQLRPSVCRPVKELRAFAKVSLEPGETGTAQFKVEPRDLAWFCTTRRAFIAEAGDYELLVAANAEDIRHTINVRLDETLTFAP